MRTLKLVSSVLFVGFLTVNCGGSPDAVNAPPGQPVCTYAGQPGCYPGQPYPGYPGYPGTVNPSLFDQECFQNRGQVYQLANNVKKCSMYVGQTLPLSSSYGRLNPSNPASQSAISLGINVRAGDQISARFSACWYSSSFVFDWGSCSGLNASGADKNGVIQYHENVPQGLLLSDGVSAELIQSSKIAARDGQLRMGVNAPGTINPASRAYVELMISRCIDGAGNLLTCPAY
jgi:hypothetical protein